MNCRALLVAYPPDCDVAVGGLWIGLHGKELVTAKLCLITVVDRIAVVICDLVTDLAVVPQHLT